MGKILAFEEGKIKVSYLRVKDVFVRNTFYYPDNPDLDVVDPSCIKGVLIPVKGSSTHRQSSIVKIFPPLFKINVR